MAPSNSFARGNATREIESAGALGLAAHAAVTQLDAELAEIGLQLRGVDVAGEFGLRRRTADFNLRVYRAIEVGHARHESAERRQRRHRGIDLARNPRRGRIQVRRRERGTEVAAVFQLRGQLRRCLHAREVRLHV
jgi:hypothetical protein